MRALAFLVATSCCPIPMSRTAVLVPDSTITVVDSHGAPVVGGQLTLRRYISAPGPPDERGRWRAVTDAEGIVRFDLAEETETVMPLMMHGVHEWGWDVCVKTPTEAGFARFTGNYDPDVPKGTDTPMILTVTTKPGASCPPLQ